MRVLAPYFIAVSKVAFLSRGVTQPLRCCGETIRAKSRILVGSVGGRNNAVPMIFFFKHMTNDVSWQYRIPALSTPRKRRRMVSRGSSKMQAWREATSWRSAVVIPRITTSWGTLPLSSRRLTTRSTSSYSAGREASYAGFKKDSPSGMRRESGS